MWENPPQAADSLRAMLYVGISIRFHARSAVDVFWPRRRSGGLVGRLGAPNYHHGEAIMVNSLRGSLPLALEGKHHPNGDTARLGLAAAGCESH